MAWNYTTKELNKMSQIEYQSLQDNPWKETGMDNLILPESTGLGSFNTDGYDEFGEENALDNILGDINSGILGDIETKVQLRDTAKETIIVNTTSTDATKGIIEETLVTKIFFSPVNVKVINDTIRFYVYKTTDNQISTQSDEQLYVIMRAMLLEFGNLVPHDPVREVKRLNNKVVTKCVDEIITELKQYKGYIDDLAKLPVPLDNPHYANKNNFTYDMSNLPQ